MCYKDFITQDVVKFFGDAAKGWLVFYFFIGNARKGFNKWRYGGSGIQQSIKAVIHLVAIGYQHGNFCNAIRSGIPARGFYIYNSKKQLNGSFFKVSKVQKCDCIKFAPINF